MKMKFLKVVLASSTILFVMFTVVFARGFESGTFPEDSTKSGNYGIYINNYQNYGHTILTVYSKHETTVTTSVTNTIDRYAVTATGLYGYRERSFFIGYGPRIYKYSGGTTH